MPKALAHRKRLTLTALSDIDGDESAQRVAAEGVSKAPALRAVGHGRPFHNPICRNLAIARSFSCRGD